MSHHGTWRGESRLWFGPDTEADRSEATAEVAANTLSYTWSYGGKPHQGTCTFTRQPDSVLATYTDTFHTSGHVMACSGVEGEGSVCVTGSYAAPPGPDWGWRTDVDTSTPGRLVVRMTNLSPEGGADLAVEMVLRRA